MRRVYRRGFNSWSTGAAGERHTARILSGLDRSGWVVLHDRSIPGSRANIDHLLIGPAGVLMVDSKQWKSKQSSLRVEQGVLWYGRYRQDKTLSTARWEAERAAAALGVPVEPIVVVHGARVPGGTLMLDGVTVIGAKRLRRLVVNRGAQFGFDASRVQQLAQLADRMLPAYVG